MPVIAPQLQKLSKSKLKDADKELDAERDAQIRAVKEKYTAQKYEIIDLLLEKEVAAVKEKVRQRLHDPYRSFQFFIFISFLFTLFGFYILTSFPSTQYAAERKAVKAELKKRGVEV